MLIHVVLLQGLSATKIAAEGKCYISKIDKDEYQSPDEMEKSLQQVFSLLLLQHQVIVFLSTKFCW